MSLPIQDEPESTIGRKPAALHDEEKAPARSGAGASREGTDEGAAGRGAREQDRGNARVDDSAPKDVTDHE